MPVALMLTGNSPAASWGWLDSPHLLQVRFGSIEFGFGLIIRQGQAAAVYAPL